WYRASGGAQAFLTAIQVVDTTHAGLAERTLFPYVCIISPTAGRRFRIRPACIGTGRCIGPHGLEARLNTFPLHFRADRLLLLPVAAIPRTTRMREMRLQELKSKTPAELVSFAEELEVENASTMRKQELMFGILKQLSVRETDIIGEGVVEVLSDGFGFLRS